MTQSLRERLAEASQRHDAFAVRTPEGDIGWDCGPCGIEGIPVWSWEDGEAAVHDHLAEAALAVFAEWLRAKPTESQVAAAITRWAARGSVGGNRDLAVVVLAALADSIAPTEGETP